MANLTPIPISSLPVIDDPTGDELIPVSAQGSDGAVRLSDVGGGGIGDITQLPAAAVISGADLMLVNQSGDNKRATAAQLREYLEGDDKVTLIPSSSGTAYQIPYSTVDTAYTGEDKVTSYLLTEHCLTEAELRTLEPIVRGNTQPSMITFVSYAQLQAGQGASGTNLTVGLKGTASLMIGGHSANPNNRKTLAIMYCVPNSTNLYPAGTYINQEYVSSFVSIAYTPGGAKAPSLVILTAAEYEALSLKDPNTVYVITEATT